MARKHKDLTKGIHVIDKVLVTLALVAVAVIYAIGLTVAVESGDLTRVISTAGSIVLALVFIDWVKPYKPRA